MPNIKDQSTVDAIAREFTGNGRDKGKALRTIGYSDSYCSTLGIGKVYSNIRVIEAIARIDDVTKSESIATRKIRQQFWTNMMTNDKANNGDKLRASELLAKSECDFIDVHTDLSDKPKDLSGNELAELRRMAITLTNKKIAKEA